MGGVVVASGRSVGEADHLSVGKLIGGGGRSDARAAMGKCRREAKGGALTPQLRECHLQVIALGTDAGDASPSVLLFTNRTRYVFNVGEGFQRFCVEHGVPLRKLDRIFFTRVCGQTSGGLAGMLLTMADGATEHHDDEPELHVHGPPRVERLMGT